MENTNRKSDPMKIYKAVETALVNINSAQYEVNDPGGTKAETNRILKEASTILAQVKADITALSVDVTVSEAIDYIVYNIDAQPKEQHRLERKPNVYAPDWPKVREDYTRQVKNRLMAFFVQPGNATFVTIDPVFFQRQARQEASEVIYGLELSS